MKRPLFIFCFHPLFLLVGCQGPQSPQVVQPEEAATSNAIYQNLSSLHTSSLSSTPSSTNVLTITSRAEISDDRSTTSFFLVLGGVVNKKILVGQEQNGEIEYLIHQEQMAFDDALHIVPPAEYKGNPQIISAWETWFGGGGFQVIVRKVESHRFSVEKRETSEGGGITAGGCGSWRSVMTVDIPFAFTLNNKGSILPHGSIAGSWRNTPGCKP